MDAVYWSGDGEMGRGRWTVNGLRGRVQHEVAVADDLFYGTGFDAAGGAESVNDDDRSKAATQSRHHSTVGAR